MYELNYWVYRIIAETEDAQIKAANDGFEAAAPKIQKSLTDLREQAPTYTARVEQIGARIEKFVSDATEVRRLGTSNRNAEAIDLVHRSIDPTYADIIAEGGKLAEDIATFMERGSDVLTEQTNTTRYTLIGVTVFGMLVGLAAAFFVALVGISRPLDSLVGVLQRMAKGEIDAEIKEAARGDEVGAVARAVDGIKAMVAQKAAEQAEIQRVADEAAAVERKRTMVELANDFERAVGSIVGTVSSAATELQATAQTMTATATQTTAQSTPWPPPPRRPPPMSGRWPPPPRNWAPPSWRSAGRWGFGQPRAAGRDRGRPDHAAGAGTQPGRRADRGDGRPHLQHRRADQPARPQRHHRGGPRRRGGPGRGFAVVAAEVKELANQTARATDEIGQRIGQVQGVTDQAVAAIGGIAGRIREISSVATGIAAAVEEQGAATQEIVRNVAQASTGTAEVTSNIVGVARASEDTGAAATQVLASASELSRQSEHLSGEVAHFLATVRAA